jgi:hypothetical protein
MYKHRLFFWERNSAHIYDATSDSWTQAANTTSGRFGSKVITMKGRIFAVAGFGSYDLSVVEEYNPITNSW